MIIGIGLDIVDISRIKRITDKFGNNFIQRILTKTEIMHIPLNRYTYIAGRFAAKEAAVKALGCGFTNGVTFKNIEICNDKFGKPYLRFFDTAEVIRNELAVKYIHLSITHERNMAAAIVILEKL